MFRCQWRVQSVGADEVCANVTVQCARGSWPSFPASTLRSECWEACRECFLARSEPGPFPLSSLLPGIAWCIVPLPAAWELGNPAALNTGKSNQISCFSHSTPSDPSVFLQNAGICLASRVSSLCNACIGHAACFEQFPKQRIQVLCEGWEDPQVVFELTQHCTYEKMTVLFIVEQY